ncbi:MAG: hypothetical protein GKR89_12075 [Candidatus Latescibacteria bacterium]|nr:hypothetical protein [Candidatus Latescibacterota bacterium]
MAAGIGLLLTTACGPRYIHLQTHPARDTATVREGAQVILGTRDGYILQGWVAHRDSSDSTLVLDIDFWQPAYISYHMRQKTTKRSPKTALPDSLARRQLPYDQVQWIRTLHPYDPQGRWDHPIDQYIWGLGGVIVGGVLVGGLALGLAFIF